MARWTCPQCDREFDRVRQSHVCAPGGSVLETFVGFPPDHLHICTKIIDYLHTLGPLHVDAVRVGVFLKTQRKLAEIRPKQRWVSLALVLPEALEQQRIARRIPVGERRIWHLIKLTTANEVDAELCSWLDRAYDAATD